MVWVGDLNIWIDVFNLVWIYFKGYVKVKDIEWEVFWVCVIIGNLLSFWKEVLELFVCYFFYLEFKVLFYGFVGYWGYVLYLYYGVF